MGTEVQSLSELQCSVDLAAASLPVKAKAQQLQIEHRWQAAQSNTAHCIALAAAHPTAVLVATFQFLLLDVTKSKQNVAIMTSNFYHYAGSKCRTLCCETETKYVPHIWTMQNALHLIIIHQYSLTA